MAWYKNEKSVNYQPSEIPEAIRNLTDLYHPDSTDAVLMKKRKLAAKNIFKKAHPELSDEEINKKFST